MCIIKGNWMSKSFNLKPTQLIRILVILTLLCLCVTAHSQQIRAYQPVLHETYFCLLLCGICVQFTHSWKLKSNNCANWKTIGKIIVGIHICWCVTLAENLVKHKLALTAAQCAPDTQENTYINESNINKKRPTVQTVIKQ